MKKAVILFTMLAVMTIGVCSAYGDTLAREGMITYSGTEAFTKLTPEERQACTSWLVYGGEMNDDCKKATMKLIAEAPEAITAKQRQALIAEASGGKNVTAEAPAPTPTPDGSNQTTIKKNDNTGKFIVLGLGILAGLIIHNNTGHRHKSTPSYQPEPPRPAPNAGRVTDHDRRPPNLGRPHPDRRPPHR